MANGADGGRPSVRPSVRPPAWIQAEEEKEAEEIVIAGLFYA